MISWVSPVIIVVEATVVFGPCQPCAGSNDIGICITFLSRRQIKLSFLFDHQQGHTHSQPFINAPFEILSVTFPFALWQGGVHQVRLLKKSRYGCWSVTYCMQTLLVNNPCTVLVSWSLLAIKWMTYLSGDLRTNRCCKESRAGAAACSSQMKCWLLCESAPSLVAEGDYCQRFGHAYGLPGHHDWSVKFLTFWQSTFVRTRRVLYICLMRSSGLASSCYHACRTVSSDYECVSVSSAAPIS